MRADGDGSDTVIPIRKPIVIPEAAQDHVPKHNYLHWAALDGLGPPPFDWLLEHWLSWHPTLLAGRGGIGKSLLVQQLGTALACGLPTWCAATKPVKVLYWACEDDHDELWRRQKMICGGLGIAMSSLDNFKVDARLGFENTLMSTEYGRPMWTPAFELLRQQVNDLGADALLLDNIGHTFGGNENVRHEVTVFVNSIAGLVQGRQFCPILLGHPAKNTGSEFSGSTAWENSVRMRWYMSDRLPDESNADAPMDKSIRMLSKRKANYTQLDYVQFNFKDGMLVPEQRDGAEDSGLMMHLRSKKARRTIIYALPKLSEVEIYCNDAAGRNYLPSVLLDHKLSDGCTKAELTDAMRRMIMAKELIREMVGKNAARKAIYGLRVNAPI